MKPREPIELPDEVGAKLRRATRIEWWTLFLMLSCVALTYTVLGKSQAMKAVFVEDLLSLVPPIAYLVVGKVRWRKPNERFPYGFAHSVSIGYLSSSLALLALGLLIFLDSLRTLVEKEHPAVGLMSVFGKQIWLGWLAIAVLVYSAIVEFTLGRIKTPVASELHDKTLASDARMNRANWLTAVAGILGILGIAAGWWWADSVAAIVISIEIVHDGWENLREVVTDILDQVPTKVEDGDVMDCQHKLADRVKRFEWVRDADVRLREEGNLLTGEVFVVPRTTESLDSASCRMRRGNSTGGSTI